MKENCVLPINKIKQGYDKRPKFGDKKYEISWHKGGSNTSF